MVISVERMNIFFFKRKKCNTKSPAVNILINVLYALNSYRIRQNLGEGDGDGDGGERE